MIGFKKALEIYREAIDNVPLLRYGWAIIGTAVLLVLFAALQLKDPTKIFAYAIVVLLISFLAYLLSSFISNSHEKPIKFGLYILVYSIVLTMSTIILSFGFFVVTDKPKFYANYFEKKTNVIVDKSCQFSDGLISSAQVDLLWNSVYWNKNSDRVVIDRIPYREGFLMHPKSQIAEADFKVCPGAKYFKAVFGFAEPANNQFAFKGSIWLDGKEEENYHISNSKKSVTIEVNVEGKEIITFKVDPLGSTVSDHAFWANPVFTF